MKKKKVLSLLLVFSMVFGLAACGSGNDAAPATTDNTGSEEAADVGGVTTTARTQVNRQQRPLMTQLSSL